MKKKLILLLLAFALLITGCANLNPTDPSIQADRGKITPLNAQQQGQDLQVTINQKDTQPVKTRTQNGQTYVPLVTILELLDYNVKETDEGSAIQAGFNDPTHQVTKNSNKASVDGENITLPSPVVTLENETYITSDSLEAFLGLGYDVQLNNNQLVINSKEEEFDFQGNEEIGNVPIDENEDVPTVSSTQANQIISSARKYLGTSYEFGASTKTTEVFDCSSFTKRVFEENGITLPRTSRSQANQGRYISVSQLQKGDLVFFNWPGRYKSNKTVGHVGIYMGNGNVIHATPSKGVHIVNAAKSSYWRGTYLGAKRVGG